MKDFLIVYEVKRRELENAFLLKVYLERNGYTCDVANFYESNYFSLFGRKRYRTILVPQLYMTENVLRVISRFGDCDRIFNLQCEQILSDDFEVTDLHTPKFEAKKAIHACWGLRTHKKLAKAGIAPDNLPVLGNISLDFCHERVISKISPSREVLAEKYNLDPKKKWVLFTSSFTFADMPEDRRRMDERLLGLDLSERINLFSRSRVELLDWFKKLVLNKDIILIYRPHPDEFNLEIVKPLLQEHSNFKLISDLNVRAWTYVSDSILNWYSTSCIEAYFLKKPYFVIRPLEIPSDIDLTVMKHVYKIQSSSELLETNLFEVDLRYHDQESLDLFYGFDEKTTSIQKHVTELVRISKLDVKHKFNLSHGGRLKSMIKSWLLFILHNYYVAFLKRNYQPSNGGLGKFLVLWLRAFHFNIANQEERKKAELLATSVFKFDQELGL